MNGLVGFFVNLFVEMQRQQCLLQSAQLGSIMERVYLLFAMPSLQSKSLLKLWYEHHPPADDLLLSFAPSPSSPLIL
jgi:uncharacterized membrane protein